MEGYVYILEVKDIALPVCKIGMTERNPRQRCAEINSGSTGDFIWEVAHSFYVNDCRKFESIIHSKLAPLRQKRREFFNIGPDAGYTAVVSILDSIDDIHVLDQPESVSGSGEDPKTIRRVRASREFKKIDSEYADLLQLFTSILNVKGRPFGQLNNPRFGISDGNRGVQWNLVVSPHTDEVWIGVNLEGSESTGRWLIADFLISRPDIETLIRRVAKPDEIFLSFYRDAWQGAARLAIREQYIGEKKFALAELNDEKWQSIVDGALGCLDESRDFRGRKRNQTVTLESDGRILERDVSPHLVVQKKLRLVGDKESNINTVISELQPVYDWVTSACKADNSATRSQD